MDMSKIITIGREFGSGGREFGMCLAQNLGTIKKLLEKSQTEPSFRKNMCNT